MRRPVQITLVAVSVLLAATTAGLFVQYQKTSADYAGLKSEGEKAQSRYAQTVDAIAEIQDSLSAISVGDANVKLLTGGLQSEQKILGPDGREALDRIAVLRASILRSKGRIRELEAGLKKNGNRIAGLQKMITKLKQTVTEKEELVAQLSGRVDSLQTEVTGLVATVEQKQETIRGKDRAIEDKRRELATVYYVVGTKKQLAASGVIVAKGGLLGIGRTLQSSGGARADVFSTLDTDQETVIRTESPKARVLSPQPATSYELRLVEGRIELHIVNPAEFRKVRQLVILTA